MHKRTLSIALSLLLLTLGVLAVPFAFAGDEAPEGEMMKEDTAAKREQMMEHHRQMLDEMKAKHEKLASLVEAMNSAGDHGESIDAITAVLNELVGQHQARMGQRIEMMEKMGDGGMMMHGKAGMHHGGEMKGHAGCSHCKGKKGHHGHHGMKGECPHGGDCSKHHGEDCPMGDDCPMHEKMHGQSDEEGQQ